MLALASKVFIFLPFINMLKDFRCVPIARVEPSNKLAVVGTPHLDLAVIGASHKQTCSFAELHSRHVVGVIACDVMRCEPELMDTPMRMILRQGEVLE